MSADIESVSQILRSILLSEKGGVLLRRLLKDYKELSGTELPFRQLGHNRVEDLIKTIPNVARIDFDYKQNEWVVKPVADERTEHVLSLVNRQKSKKKRVFAGGSNSRGRGGGRGGGRPVYYNRYASGGGSTYQSNQNSRPSYNSFSSRGPAPAPSTQRVASNITSMTKKGSGSFGGSNTRMYSDNEVSSGRADKQTVSVPPRFQRKDATAPQQNPPSQPSINPPQTHSENKTRTLQRTIINDSNKENAFDVKPISKPSDNKLTDDLQSLTFNVQNDVALYRRPPSKGPPSYQPSMSVEPHKQIPVGVETEIFICHINNPMDFYVHRKESQRGGESVIDSLMDSVAASAKYSYSPIHRDQAVNGTFLLAKFNEDDTWCRGKVTDNNVFFVDFGNMQPLRESELSRMLPGNNSIPFQAIHCSLDGLILEELAPFPTATAAFKAFYSELSEIDKEHVVIKVVRVTEDELGEPLYLVELYNRRGFNMADRLLSHGIANSALNQQIRLQSEAVNTGETHRVYVTAITADNTMAVRLQRRRAEYERLVEAMQLYYLEQRCAAVDGVGSLRDGDLVLVADRGDCFRGSIVSVDGRNAVIDFLDDGDQEEVALLGSRTAANVLPLPSEFADALPAQCVYARVVGLGKYADDVDFADQLDRLMLGKYFVMRVVDAETVDGVVVAELRDELTGGLVSVDTVVSQCAKVEELAPVVPEKGGIFQGCISYVAADGTVYLHVGDLSEGRPITEGMLALDRLMDDLTSYFAKARGSQDLVNDLSVGKVVACRWSQDASEETRWYRAVILHVVGNPLASDAKVKVKFVDYGNTETLNRTELREAVNASRYAHILPHQAVPCRVSVPWLDEYAEVMARLIHTPVTVKVVEHAALPTAPHTVEVYFRTEEGLRSFRSLVAHVHLQPTAVAVDLSRGFRISDLPKLALPREGDYYDVNVTEVLDPHTVSVQPWESTQELADLAAEMQTYYVREGRGVLEDNFELGYLTVVLHEDGLVYRAQLRVTCGAETEYSVYLVDYGDFAIIAKESMYKLVSAFTLLPPQSIKLRLGGINSPGGRYWTWSEETCNYLTSLMLNKQFVLQVTGVRPNHNGIPSIRADVFDTSGEEDVNINDKLISKGFAIRGPCFI